MARAGEENLNQGTGLEAGCVEELAFILTALGEGLQRLALGVG